MFQKFGKSFTETSKIEINQETIDLIKKWEGFKGQAYKDPVGIWTIGYGTTAGAGVGIVPVPGMIITEEEAEGYLLMALQKFLNHIAPNIKVEPNENQLGAMLSLAYNIGPGAFNKSTLLRKWNAGDVQGAAEQFLVWNKAGGQVLKGLIRRRAEEKELFEKPVAPKKTSILEIILRLLGLIK